MQIKGAEADLFLLRASSNVVRMRNFSGRPPSMDSPAFPSDRNTYLEAALRDHGSVRSAVTGEGFLVVGEEFDLQAGFGAQAVRVDKETASFPAPGFERGGDELGRASPVSSALKSPKRSRGRVARPMEPRGAGWAAVRYRPGAQVAAAVVDVGLAADVLPALALHEAAFVPRAVRPDGDEDKLMGRLAEMDAIVADDKALVDDEIGPFPCRRPKGRTCQ